MTTVAYDWLSNLKHAMNEHSDPRTKGLPFMDSPVPIIILSISYLYLVCKAAPQYMKDRKPYNLKTAITIYNILQILACIYLLHGMLSLGSIGFFECDEKITLNSKNYQLAKLIWWTFILKLSEFVETVFFVLRKKQNQVSGLHLYHHVSTLSFAWLTSKFAPGIAAVTPIVLNCFIHVLMYSYYLIALHGGKELQKKIVLWKKTLTILQMVQFTIIIIHLMSGLNGRCKGPLFLLQLMILNIFINYFLFFRFYKKTYKKLK